jgi:hypothetical protein
MIITKKRDMDAILDNIRNYRHVFLLGCSECATLCATGGAEQLEEMKTLLTAQGKEVTGMFVAKTGCQVLGTKVELRQHAKRSTPQTAFSPWPAVQGHQTAVELFEDKPVYTVNDTLFLGNMTRLQQFHERCSSAASVFLTKPVVSVRSPHAPKASWSGPAAAARTGSARSAPTSVRLGQDIRADEENRPVTGILQYHPASQGLVEKTQNPEQETQRRRKRAHELTAGTGEREICRHR